MTIRSLQGGWGNNLTLLSTEQEAKAAPDLGWYGQFPPTGHLAKDMQNNRNTEKIH